MGLYDDFFGVSGSSLTPSVPSSGTSLYDSFFAESEAERRRKEELERQQLERVAGWQAGGDQQWAGIQAGYAEPQLPLGPGIVPGMGSVLANQTGRMASGIADFAGNIGPAITSLGQTGGPWDYLVQPFTDVTGGILGPIGETVAAPFQASAEYLSQTPLAQNSIATEEAARAAAGPIGNLGYDVLGVAPQVAGMVAAGPGWAMPMLAAAAGGQKMQQGQEAGLSEMDAARSGLLSGAVEAGTESLGFGTLGRIAKMVDGPALKTLSQIRQTVAQNFGAEAGEEIIASLGNEIVDRSTNRDGRPLDLAEVVEIVKRAGYSGLVGGLSGGAIGGVGGVTQYEPDRPPLFTPEQEASIGGDVAQSLAAEAQPIDRYAAGVRNVAESREAEDVSRQQDYDVWEGAKRQIYEADEAKRRADYDARIADAEARFESTRGRVEDTQAGVFTDRQFSDAAREEQLARDLAGRIPTVGQIADNLWAQRRGRVQDSEAERVKVLLEARSVRDQMLKEIGIGLPTLTRGQIGYVEDASAERIRRSREGVRFPFAPERAIEGESRMEPEPYVPAPAPVPIPRPAPVAAETQIDVDADALRRARRGAPSRPQPPDYDPAQVETAAEPKEITEGLPLQVPDDALGVVAPGSQVAASAAKKLWQGTKRFAKKNLTSAGSGLVGEPFTELKLAGVGATRAAAHEAQRNLNDIQSFLPREAKAAKTTVDSLKSKVGEVLFQRGDADTLPANIRSRVLAVRSQIDQLSTENAAQLEEQASEWQEAYLGSISDPEVLAEAEHRIAEVALGNEVEGARPREVKIGKQLGLARIIRENRGEYGHVSYRTHFDPTWARELFGEEETPSPKWVSLREELKALPSTKEHPDFSQMSDEQLDAEMWSMAHQTVEDSFALPGTSGVPTTDTGAYKHRQNLPKVLKEIYGEITDPIQKANVTAHLLARNVAAYNMFKGIRDLGLADGFVSKGKKAGFDPVPGVESRNPLGGLHIKPDYRQALEAATREAREGFIAALRAATGLSKEFLTVHDPGVHSGNVLSNFAATLAAGNLGTDVWAPWTKMAPEIPNAFRTLERSRGAGLRTRLFQKTLGRTSIPGIGNLYKFGVEKGVYGSQVDLADQRKMMRAKSIEPLQGSAGKAVNTLSGYRAAAQDLYGKEDELPKHRTWRRETQKILWASAHGTKDGKPTISLKAALTEAAKIATSFHPTAERTVPITDWFRQAPLLGSFVMFPTEVPRTLKNVVVRGVEEVQSSNPRTKAIGIHRLTSVALGILSLPAISVAAIVAARAINEDKKKKRFDWIGEGYGALLPSYVAGKSLPVLYEGHGKAVLMDISRLNYYGPVESPIIAGMKEKARGAGYVGAVGAGMAAAAEPYAGLGVVARPITEAIHGETQTGREIYHEYDPTGEKIARGVGHVVHNSFTPGVLKRISRISDRETMADKFLEGVAVVGPRFFVINMEKDLPKAVSRIDRAGDAIVTGWRSALRPVVSDEDRAEARTVAEGRAKRWAYNLHQAVTAARRTGLSDKEIRSLLDKGNLPHAYSKAALESQEELLKLFGEKMDDDLKRYLKRPEDWREHR